MNRKQRIQILKNAQAPVAPVGPSGPSTATVSVVPPKRIDIRAVPGFNPNLFSAKSDIINDINNIANIINTNLSALSTGAITFETVWTNPSVSGSQSSGSVKNLLNLAKWIYNVIKSRAQAYSLDGLRAIATGLINTIRTYSFPEDSAASVQGDLVNAAQTILTKLGPGNH
jgi:hypothetical protein